MSCCRLTCVDGDTEAPWWHLAACAMPRACAEFAKEVAKEGAVQPRELVLSHWTVGEAEQMAQCLEDWFEGRHFSAAPPLSLLDFLGPPVGVWKGALLKLKWRPGFPIRGEVVQALALLVGEGHFTLQRWFNLKSSNLAQAAEWARSAKLAMRPAPFNGNSLSQAYFARLCREAAGHWDTTGASGLPGAFAVIVAAARGVAVTGQIEMPDHIASDPLIRTASALPWALYSPEALRETIVRLLADHPDARPAFRQRMAAALIAYGGAPLPEVAPLLAGLGVAAS